MYVQYVLFGIRGLPGTSFQTESAISPYLVVADIHRNVLTEQDAASGQSHSVGATCYPLIAGTYYRLDSSQVSDPGYYGTRSLTFP